MQLAEEAGGGEVDILDPMDLINNFSKLLSNKVVASNVIIKIKLHRLLKFRNENPEFFGKNQDDTTFEQWIGNVTVESLYNYIKLPIHHCGSCPFNITEKTILSGVNHTSQNYQLFIKNMMAVSTNE